VQKAPEDNKDANQGLNKSKTPYSSNTIINIMIQIRELSLLSLQGRVPGASKLEAGGLILYNCREPLKLGFPVLEG